MRGRFTPWKGAMGEDLEAWLTVAAGLLFGFLAASSQATAGQGLRQSGVVVEEVGEGSALERAGLEAGDVLLAWERLPNPPANPEGAEGEIPSVFDWLWLKQEQAPRGTVKLIGEREGVRKLFEVTPGLWDAKARARLPTALLDNYLRGKELVEAGDLVPGITLWKRVAELAQGQKYGLLLCWLQLRIGDAWAEERAWERAHAAYRSALKAAREPVAQVAVWDAIGKSYQRQNDLPQAETSYRSSLEIRQAIWSESLSLAQSNSDLGIIMYNRGDLAAAEAYFQRALVIRERMAPNSPILADAFNNLGRLSWGRGNLATADAYFQRAVQILVKVAPNSLNLAKIFNNLANVADVYGNLAVAESYHLKSLAIKEKVAPNSLHLAHSFHNLGVFRLARGDLAEAEDYCQQALAIRENLGFNGLDLAASFDALGNVAQSRGDLATAKDYYERALVIKEKVTPDSFHLYRSFHNLGSVAENSGNLATAEAYYQRAIALLENLEPDNPDLAASFNNLGNVALTYGNLAIAETHHQRALAIREKTLPNSLALADSLDNLGILAQRRNDLDVAAKYLQRALEIRDELAPASLNMASNLNSLGIVARGQGQTDLAASYFDRSVTALEAQVERLGGSQAVKGSFRAQYGQYYRDYIEHLLQTNKPEDAFSILERSRARSFLAMLAQRDLAFHIPEELAEARRSLAVRYDRTMRQMARLSPIEEPEKINEHRRELASLQRERSTMIEKIRKNSPKFAALQYPQPLNLPQVQEILDSGTVMLSYSVGKEQTDLFVVTPDQALRVHTLALGKAKLRNEVERLRKLIEKAKPGSSLGAIRKKDLERLSKRLYKSLVEPAQDVVASSERVVIIPDGPLHLLPFGALIRETGDSDAALSRNGQYLIEWKPLHSVLSATVYAELKKTRRDGGQLGNGPSPVLLTSFGDPHYPESLTPKIAEDIADVRVRSAVKRGLFDEFTRLPYTRREVVEIAGLYPPEAIRTYLGEEATEERAKAIDRGTRIVHFATHGHVDDRFPLNSALALTMPEGFPEDRDNGLLQVWEIFERVRLDADLVVLSACETGVGKEQGGEGLIGLTRAFQYAGARTVAASLWSVQDRSTAELMVRFYRHLRSGLPKDEALRAAQIELIRGPIEVRSEAGKPLTKDWTAPYYWAAFQILGDRQ